MVIPVLLGYISLCHAHLFFGSCILFEDSAQVVFLWGARLIIIIIIIMELLFYGTKERSGVG